MQTGFAFSASKTLLSAVELELFTKLANKPQDLETLQQRYGLHPRAARDFLDALVALGFLRREDGFYSNTPETDYFLDKAKPSYIGAMLELTSSRIFPNWSHLTEAVLTGRAENGSESLEETYSEFDAGSEETKDFLRAMSSFSDSANRVMARSLPWKDYTTFVDVGTAQGDLAVQIALANPHLKGIGFDLPPVAPVFREYADENRVADRLEFVGGNFFTDPLPKGDVVLFGHVLLNWDLDKKKMLLRKAYEALPSGGTVVVYEAIIDDDRCQNAFGLMVSLNMLVATKAGFVFTGADCKEWMEEAGFRNIRMENLDGADSMVVGLK